MKSQAIIPAAGVGQRLKSAVTKPLILLKGKPLFVYAIETFEKSSLVESIIIAVNREHIAEFEKIIKQSRFTKTVKVVSGGETRSESVFNGLQTLDSDTDIVVIHDGARPFVSLDMIDAAINACQENNAVILAVPVKSTIKRVNPQNSTVEATLKRDVLWAVQTPQVFKKNIICKAHNEFKNLGATDDASLVERMGEDVKVILGDYHNIKITTRDDLAMAEAILDNQEP